MANARKHKRSNADARGQCFSWNRLLRAERHRGGISRRRDTRWKWSTEPSRHPKTQTARLRGPPVLLPMSLQRLKPMTEQSVVVPAIAVDVAVLDLFGRSFAHFDDLDVEMQVFAGHRVIQIDIDHAHPHFLDRHRARADIGLQHNLHTRHQALVAEMFLGDALAQAFAALAVGLGGGHVDGEALAGFAAFHCILKAGNDVVVADQDRQRVGAQRAFGRRLAHFANGVVETNSAVFFDFHTVLGDPDGSEPRSAAWAGLIAGGRCGQMAGVKTNQRKTAAHYPCSPAPAPSMQAQPAQIRVGSAGAQRVGIQRAALLVACLTLAGCGGGEMVRKRPPQSKPAKQAAEQHRPLIAPNDPAAANGVLMRAIGLVGTPYRYGGNTPESGFDCSGLVTYVFRDMLDLRLPRTSRELAAIQGPRIDPNRLIAADLVFFGRKGEVEHVGIYVGDGRFVHAPRTGGTVRLDRLDGPYWRERYTGAKRVLK
jgi:cell wall-associated NlpC family hydrolase